MIVRLDMIVYFHKTSFRILGLTNNFYNKQFHQNRLISRHMDTRQNQCNFKNTTTSELKDQRPVSTLPILSKIYERVVLQQITNFIEKKLIYHHDQSGYRKNHSTETLLVKLRVDIKEATKASKITLAVFTDYSKAFDTIDFSVLIKKMHTLNFSKRFLYWIFSYLTDRRHFLPIDSNISNILYTDFGVPQGSILGTVLFNLCVADVK